jgi:DNA-binding winged helix-turn-helix (wHTH) protein/Tol biopolymer transport system component
VTGVGENGTRSVQFGVFEVDLRAGELRRNGSKVKLQEQPFQILSLLLERPGEVITREELQSKLWPADTFVDFDHGLNAAIRRLRDALGDSAESPRFVETVARRGYRFLAPVNGMGESVAAPPQLVPRSRHWRFMALAALLLAGIGVGWMLAHWPRALIHIRQQRLTANAADNPVLGAVISPDGKTLAFSDKTGFYLRQVDSGETHPLTLQQGFNAVPVSWYPDGTHLLVTWVEGPKSRSSLWQISIFGGAPRKLLEDVRFASLSRDGSQIALVRAGLDAELWVMGVNGENPRRLVFAERSVFGTPAWSPDGRGIAYARGTYDLATWGLTAAIVAVDPSSGSQQVVMSLPTSNPELVDGGHFGPGLVWTPDNHLLYSVSEPPPNQADSNLWSVPLDSHGGVAGRALRLTASPDDVSSLNASADGKRIAYTKHSVNPAVYISELQGAGTQLSTPQRLTLDEWKNLPFTWTPDSKAIIFVSDRDGVFHIFRQQVDQKVPELLVGGDESATLPRLTPDNSTLLYVVWPKLGESSTPSRLMRVPLAGGPPQMVLQRSGLGNLQCARAPSTLCLYDVRTATRLSFFRFDPATGASEEVPQLRTEAQAAYDYNWSLSPDGKILAAARKLDARGNASIEFYSLEDGSKRTVTATAWAGISSIDFAADGRSLWAPVYTNTGTWALLNIDLEGKSRTVLEDTEMEIGWAIPAPDGKHLALWKARGTSNVWMLER